MKRTIKSMISENIVLKLMALLSAVILWLVILNIDDPINSKTFTGVPVTIQNESIITNSGMIYQIEDGSNMVSVTVRARRSVLSRLRTDRIQAIADMNNLSLDTLVPIKVEIPGFEGSYESALANPNNLHITIEKNGTVRLPISVSTTGNLAPGYFIESTNVSPGTIVISGPETQVERINTVVLRTDVSQLSATETLTGTLLYYDNEGVQLDSTVLTASVTEEDIYVTVKIHPVKEIPIEVIAEGTPAEGYELTEIKVEPKTVAVIGKADVLNSVDKLVLEHCGMDLEGTTIGLELVCDLTEYLPDGISLAEGASDKVMITAKIERSGTAMIEYPVGSIVINNAPAGYKVNYELHTELKLEFTGSLPLLEKLTADDLKVSIDLADIDREGRYEVPVHIEAPTGCMPDRSVKVSVNLVKE